MLIWRWFPPERLLGRSLDVTIHDKNAELTERDKESKCDLKHLSRSTLREIRRGVLAMCQIT